MSLSKPHPIWTSCGSNIYELNKASVQAKYLSGRFRTDTLLAHFNKENLPFCPLHPAEERVVGDLAHHLLHCSALCPQRENLLKYWDSMSSSVPACNRILKQAADGSEDDFQQLVLDCSSVPEVIKAASLHGEVVFETIFKATRTYCYSMYRKRLNLLNQYI